MFSTLLVVIPEKMEYIFCGSPAATPQNTGESPDFSEFLGCGSP